MDNQRVDQRPSYFFCCDWVRTMAGLFILGVILFIGGLVTIWTGKVRLTHRTQLQGRAARFAGVLCIGCGISIFAIFVYWVIRLGDLVRNMP